MTPFVRKLALFSTKPIFAEPNAGKPTLSADGKLMYKTTPEEFAVQIEDYVELRANIVDGCCGIGPEQIKYMTALIGERRPSKRETKQMNVVTNRTYMMNISPFLII